MPITRQPTAVCRSGIPARHRAVEHAPSLDESPMSGKYARPTGSYQLRIRGQKTEDCATFGIRNQKGVIMPITQRLTTDHARSVL
jgi:hypothetical protein